MTHLSDSIVHDHRLATVDARVKLAATAVLLILVLSSGTLLFPLLTAGAAFALCLHLGVPLRRLLLRLSEPLIIALVLIVVKFLFTGTAAAMTLQAGGLTVTGHADGLREGLLIGSRIAGSVCLLALLGFSTPFAELLSALAWFRAPRTFVEILVFAHRYIFMLFDEAFTIYHAQKNRLGYSTLSRGLSSFGALAGSLTLRAFEHSQQTSVAMAQRGYDGSLPLHRHRPFKGGEVVYSSLLVLAVAVLWRIQ